jgi:hypothetical protein
MGEDRLHSLYLALARADGDLEPQGRIEAICALCRDLLSVSGAGVMLMADRAHQGTIHATDERISLLEELQNAAAQGPCLDAYHLGRPVCEPDLAGQGRRTWPVLAAGALDAGMAALFSFPLQLDDTSFGALNLYREHPGALTAEETADARLLAAVVAREVIVLQATAVPGSLPSGVADLSGDRSAIEQATGMVSVQMGGSVVDAARLLRARAVADGRPLALVAHDVVARTLRFTQP